MVCFRSRCLKNAQTATSVDWHRATGLNDIEWMLTRWLVDPRFSQIQSRGNSAASFGTGCRDSWRLESFDVSFASEGEMAKAYERICKKWAKRVVHHDGPCESRWEFCRHASLGIFHFEHLQLWTLWDLWDFQASLSDLSKALLLAACIPDSEPGSPVRIESIADRTGVTEQLGRLGDGGAWWYQLQPACYVWFTKDILAPNSHSFSVCPNKFANIPFQKLCCP